MIVCNLIGELSRDSRPCFKATVGKLMSFCIFLHCRLRPDILTHTPVIVTSLLSRLCLYVDVRYYICYTCVCFNLVKSLLFLTVHLMDR